MNNKIEQIIDDFVSAVAAILMGVILLIILVVAILMSVLSVFLTPFLLLAGMIAAIKTGYDRDTFYLFPTISSDGYVSFLGLKQQLWKR